MRPKFIRWMQQVESQYNPIKLPIDGKISPPYFRVSRPSASVLTLDGYQKVAGATIQKLPRLIHWNSPRLLKRPRRISWCEIKFLSGGYVGIAAFCYSGSWSRSRGRKPASCPRCDLILIALRTVHSTFPQSVFSHLLIMFSPTFFVKMYVVQTDLAKAFYRVDYNILLVKIRLSYQEAEYLRAQI